MTVELLFRKLLVISTELFPVALNLVKSADVDSGTCRTLPLSQKWVSLTVLWVYSLSALGSSLALSFWGALVLLCASILRT